MYRYIRDPGTCHSSKTFQLPLFLRPLSGVFFHTVAPSESLDRIKGEEGLWGVRDTFVWEREQLGFGQ